MRRVLPPDPDEVALADRVLTDRQLQVMQMRWAGESFATIGQRLDLAKATVIDHRDASMRRIKRAALAEGQRVG